jgi:hypothetical protein
MRQRAPRPQAGAEFCNSGFASGALLPDGGFRHKIALAPADKDYNGGVGATMPHVRKTIEELIAEEEKKSEQARARIAELKAQRRADERKRDAHRKIVVGAAVIAHVKIDPHFRKEVRDALTKAVTDPKHKAVIPDLLDEKAFQESMRAAAKKAADEAKEAAVATGAEDEEAKGAEAAAANEPAQAAKEPGRTPQQRKHGPDSQGAPPA